MNKFWLPIILMLSMFEVHGQTANSPEEILKERLRRYCESVPWEEIYTRTDRDEYISGEDLWFNIYLIDRQKNTLSDHSSLSYIELINPENRQIIGQRIRLENGVGPGHILLPDTLSTGKYIIRAYTNWMKNFLPYNYFYKEITIYNALSEKSFKSRYGRYANNHSKATDINFLKAESGLEMKVKKPEPGRTEITLIADKRFMATNKEKCYLLVQTHGVASLVRTINLQEGAVKTYLPDEIFIPGINQIVIFNSELKPLLERFIYTPKEEPGCLNVSSADTFRTRERVNIKVNFNTNESELLTSPDLSISVTAETGRHSMPDIDDYIIFGTEFGFLPETIRNHKLNLIAADTIDQFLIGVKSNWIDWEHVISGTAPSLKYQAEKDYHYIRGRLIDKTTQLTLSDKTVFLSIPGRTATFQYSRTDSSGLFSFTLPLSNDVWDLIVQPEDPAMKSSIMIESAFSEGYLQNSENADTIMMILPDFISKWGVNYQVRKIYKINSTADTISRAIYSKPPKRFYGKPDIELSMKDYIKLPVMEEVFFELTPGVQLKRKKNSYNMTIADPVTNRIHEKPPVLLIDGVVINNPAVVAGLDPETVEKIDVVKDLYLVGDYMFFGIINVITAAGDFSGTALPENAARFKYNVVEPVSSFSSPDYSSDTLKRSRIPDFRNTLYWNPSVIQAINEKEYIEFWTSDGVGSFEINLQGINNKGEPVSYRKAILIR